MQTQLRHLLLAENIPLGIYVIGYYTHRDAEKLKNQLNYEEQVTLSLRNTLAELRQCRIADQQGYYRDCSAEQAKARMEELVAKYREEMPYWRFWRTFHQPLSEFRPINYTVAYVA